MWVYQQSEATCWTVGYFTPGGRWETDSDHSDKAAAGRRCAELNGGAGRAELELRLDAFGKALELVTANVRSLFDQTGQLSRRDADTAGRCNVLAGELEKLHRQFASLPRQQPRAKEAGSVLWYGWRVVTGEKLTRRQIITARNAVARAISRKMRGDAVELIGAAAEKGGSHVW